jgi:hypothetical protein
LESSKILNSAFHAAIAKNASQPLPSRETPVVKEAQKRAWSFGDTISSPLTLRAEFFEFLFGRLLIPLCAVPLMGSAVLALGGAISWLWFFVVLGLVIFLGWLYERIR